MSLAPYGYGRHFAHADYKVGIDYDIAPRVMLYAATQTGYQPGTFNAFASTPALSNAVNQATLTAYTAGVKSRFLDDRIQINDETFYYDYRGLFASAYNTVLNSNQTFNFHDFALPTGYVRAEAGSRYEDAFYADFSHTPGGRQQPYIKSNASLTYFSSRGGWSVGAWIKNIENVAVIAATAGGSNLPALAAGATAFIEAPRTYGMRVTYGF